MKDGDKFLEQVRRRNLVKFYYILLTSPEYDPDWLYWGEWAYCNKN